MNPTADRDSHMLTVEEALSRIAEVVSPVAAERVPLSRSLGAILAKDLVSPADSPPFDKSMMDGYALRAADVSGSSSPLRVTDEVMAGQVCRTEVVAGTAVRIMTGAPIPTGADAVLPVEQTELDEQTSTVRSKGGLTVNAGLNIVRRGSNMWMGESVMRAGQGIRPQEVALLAELGVSAPLVHRQPRVAVLATGDELVDVGQIPGPGQIRNSNALMLAAQLQQMGAEPVLLGIARDNEKDLREKIGLGLASDFLCLSGGVSAGKLDLVPGVLEQAGVRAEFHKIRMKPGKPLWFGGRPEGADRARCIVFGLPGNPVSSMVCCEIFVRAALRAFQGVRPSAVPQVTAFLEAPFQHRSDRPTWFPATFRMRQGRGVVQPVRWQGSSDLRSTVDANCSLVLPAGEYSGSPGDLVEILPWGGMIAVAGYCQHET